MIAFCENNLKWRIIGHLGGLSAIIFSGSREAVIALPIALAIYSFVRLPPLLLCITLFVFSAVGMVFLFCEINPLVLFEQTSEAVSHARLGSSIGRDLIYEYSFRGFMESPFFGKGWIGASVHPTEELPIGSHSTFFGVLYTGGLTTFTALIVASGATIITTFVKALQGDTTACASLSILGALVLFCYGESVFGMIQPCLIVFFFIGGALHNKAPLKDVGTWSISPGGGHGGMRASLGGSDNLAPPDRTRW